MNQSQQYPGLQRIPSSYGSNSDELHLAGLSQPPQHQHQHQQPHAPSALSSSREYAPAPAGALSAQHPVSSSAVHYQSQASSVPNVLQPAGGMVPRPPPLSSNTTPSMPSMPMTMSPLQGGDYAPKAPSAGPSSHQHSYSRSSPAAGTYGDASPYHAYAPTTPSSSLSAGQFMSPDIKYQGPAAGTQRIPPNTPLGLADIRPRADSSMSDALPGSLAYELANMPPGVSNYLAPWTAYAFDWCKWTPHANGAGKLALASHLEDGHNFIHILESHIVPTPQDVYLPGTSKYSIEFTKVAEATHSYPVTRMLWEPQSTQKQSTDLLATSGDHLRLWSLPMETPSPQSNTITRGDRNSRPIKKLTPLALLSNSKTPDHTAPLTSLDWNTVSPSLIITSSIDTTCTIWDIPSLTAKTQLIAHDKEVYDVRFCANSVDVFVSCGQDGSVRMFDLRSLEHSTIIYEPTSKEDRVDASGARMSPTLAQQTMTTPPPLLRLATSPHDTHLLATFAQDSNIIRLLDVRQPGQALAELCGHGGSVNCIEWSPLRRGILASGGDDCQVLLWDAVGTQGNPPSGPGQPDVPRSLVASWQCDYEIGNLGWVPRLNNNDYGDWLGVSAGRGIWGVRVG